MTIDTSRIEAAVAEIIAAIGEDASRPGILDTPRRVFIAVALPYVLAALTMTRREVFLGNV